MELTDSVLDLVLRDEPYASPRQLAVLNTLLVHEPEPSCIKELENGNYQVVGMCDEISPACLYSLVRAHHFIEAITPLPEPDTSDTPRSEPPCYRLTPAGRRAVAVHSAREELRMKLPEIVVETIAKHAGRLELKNLKIVNF